MRLIYLLFFISLTIALPNLSKQQRKALADKADTQIDFITPVDLESSLQTGTKFLFFGATWCKFTQLFTPHYLSAQQKVKETRLFEGTGFEMRKVECSTNADYCSNRHGVNEYPTVLMYVNGKKVEEYLGEDTQEAFYAYLVEKVDAYRKTHKTEPKTEDKEPAKIQGKKQVSQDAKMTAGDPGIKQESQASDQSALPWIGLGAGIFILGGCIWYAKRVQSIKIYRKLSG